VFWLTRRGSATFAGNGRKPFQKNARQTLHRCQVLAHAPIITSGVAADLRQSYPVGMQRLSALLFQRIRNLWNRFIATPYSSAVMILLLGIVGFQPFPSYEGIVGWIVLVAIAFMGVTSIQLAFFATKILSLKGDVSPALAIRFIVVAVLVFILAFAVIYFHLSHYDPEHAFNTKEALSAVTSIYFTIVTFATVGYGDIYPANDFYSYRGRSGDHACNALRSAGLWCDWDVDHESTLSMSVGAAVACITDSPQTDQSASKRNCRKCD
jgi:hypothetical protein